MQGLNGFIDVILGSDDVLIKVLLCARSLFFWNPGPKKTKMTKSGPILVYMVESASGKRPSTRQILYENALHSVLVRFYDS